MLLFKINAVAGGSLGSAYSTNSSYFANHTSVNLALDENQSGYSFISTIMSPYICRLPEHETSYMSLRHVRDLKVIRPILDFLIENQADIFAGLVPLNNNLESSGIGAIKGIQQYSRSHANQSVESPTIYSGNGNETVKGSAQTFPNIPQIHIPLMDAPHSKPVDVKHDNLNTSISLQNVNLNSWEWKVFEALVSSTVSSFLSSAQPHIPTFQQLSPCPSFSYQIRRKSSVGDDDFDYIPDISNSSAPNGCILFGNSWNNSEKDGGECTVESIKAKYNCEFSSNSQVRKQMVSDCRKLRAQVIKFEDEWTATHHRAPKVTLLHVLNCYY